MRVYMAQAREALGAARTEAAIRAGRDMSFEDAVGEARAAAGRYERAAAR